MIFPLHNHSPEWMIQKRHLGESYDSAHKPLPARFFVFIRGREKNCLLKVQVVPSVSPLLQTDGQNSIIDMNKLCPK